MSRLRNEPQVTAVHGPAASRREFLHVGFLAGLGLSLGDLLRLEAAAETETAKLPKAKAVIQIYMPGGMAHQETFDPKPSAPVEYRGEMSSIETVIPGVRFNELLKETATVADKLTVCRSTTHTEADHGRGTHNMFTGYRPSPALVYPSMGSIVSHEYGPKNEMPAYVCIPNQPTPFAGSGYLGSAFGPFALGSDPGSRGYSVRDLSLPKGIDDQRFEKRRNIKTMVDDHFSTLEKSSALDAMDAFNERAYAMVSSVKAREAFNLDAEPASVKAAYGVTSGGAGRGGAVGFGRGGGAGPRLLVARRLIEAGVRFVSLTYGAWDTHVYHFRTMGFMVPQFDRAFAALIRDLSDRGMLESTLVIITTEFGRTPKVNTGSGRDHWPKVFSLALAGGGIKQGQVYGSSNAIAAEPEDNPLSPEDLATTLYHQLGIEATKELLAPGNRPIRIVNEGKVINDLLA